LNVELFLDDKQVRIASVAWSNNSLAFDVIGIHDLAAILCECHPESSISQLGDTDYFFILNIAVFYSKSFKALNGLLCADVLLRNYSLTHYYC